MPDDTGLPIALGVYNFYVLWGHDCTPFNIELFEVTLSSGGLYLSASLFLCAASEVSRPTVASRYIMRIELNAHHTLVGWLAISLASRSWTSPCRGQLFQPVQAFVSLTVTLAQFEIAPTSRLIIKALFRRYPSRASLEEPESSHVSPFCHYQLYRRCYFAVSPAVTLFVVTSSTVLLAFTLMRFTLMDRHA